MDLPSPSMGRRGLEPSAWTIITHCSKIYGYCTECTECASVQALALRLLFYPSLKKRTFDTDDPQSYLTVLQIRKLVKLLFGEKLELDCCFYYPAGWGPRLPSRRQVACAEPELDCCCYYPAGWGLCLPLHRLGACVELELDCGCYEIYWITCSGETQFGSLICMCVWMSVSEFDTFWACVLQPMLRDSAFKRNKSFCKIPAFIGNQWPYYTLIETCRPYDTLIETGRWW